MRAAARCKSGYALRSYERTNPIRRDKPPFLRAACGGGTRTYKLSDKSSFGFVFRYGKKIPILNAGFNAGSKIFWFRYSKQSKKWIIGNESSTI